MLVCSIWIHTILGLVLGSDLLGNTLRILPALFFDAFIIALLLLLIFVHVTASFVYVCVRACMCRNSATYLI